MYAVAPGFGVQWTGSLFVLTNQKEVTTFQVGRKRLFGSDDELDFDLVLRPKAGLRGRIVDEEGQPIPNAWVGIWSASAIPKNKVFETTDGFFTSGSESTNIMYVKRVMPDKLRNAKVNKEGWFEFEHAPVDAKLWLEVAAPNFGRRKIYAVTTSWDSIGFKEPQVYRDGMVLRFPKPIDVNVQVVLGDTNEPADGVFVSLSNKTASQWKLSNAEGGAEFRIPPGEYRLVTAPAHGTPYLGTRTGQLKVKGVGEKHVVRMERGVQVFIQVVDAKTGGGIRDAQLWVDDPKRDYSFRSFKRPRTSMFNDHKSNGDGNIRAIVKQGARKIGVRKILGYRMVEEFGIEIDAKVGKKQRIKIEMRQ